MLFSKTAKLNSICFIFENCESLTIPAEHIFRLFIQIPQLSISFFEGNPISDSFIANDIYISFNDTIVDVEEISSFGDAISFHRLQDGDITGIVLRYEQEETKDNVSMDTEATHITVPWQGANMFYNPGQVFEYNKSKNALSNRYRLTIRKKSPLRNKLQYIKKQYKLSEFKYSKLSRYIQKLQRKLRRRK